MGHDYHFIHSAKMPRDGSGAADNVVEAGSNLVHGAAAGGSDAPAASGVDRSNKAAAPRHLRRVTHWRVCSHQAAAALDQHSQGAEMAQSSRLPTRSLRSKANRLGGYDDVMGDATGNS